MAGETAAAGPSSAATPQTTYPPTASVAPAAPTAGPSRPLTHTHTTSYLVSTETDSIADLRLQITEDVSASSSSRPPRPLYFRQRTLSAQDEILDSLIDANTGHAIWTIHRPTRGWYLHIRSPALPPNSTIPIRPARLEFVTSTMGVLDPTATPLTFSLGTKVRWDSVARCKEWIGDVEGDSFEEVHLVNEAEATVDSTTTFTKGHTARTSSISSSAVQSVDQRHARRRSAGPSPDLRRMNLSGTFPKVTEGEGEQEQESSVDSIGTTTDSKHLHPSGGAHLHPSDGTSAAHRPPSQGRASPGDEPYRSSSNSHSTPTHATQCYFLLLDGAARTPPRVPSTNTSSAPGRLPTATRLGWAKWVWSLVPEPIRPPLSFDTSKSFSLRWIDVQQRSIEIMRYEDTSGYWLWQSKTRGRFVFQEEALRALAIDRGFWFATALAYLDFLEERDGYNAASDG